ncbi:MAG: ATP-binding protein [Acidobacteriota bacterium]
MREIVVLSGKGGAGKTSLTAAFAALARNKILCDLDVDAPDLHILLDPFNTDRRAFVSGNLARINANRCDGCGLCQELCRFGAVGPGPDGTRQVLPHRCEGCKTCVALCPRGAIDFLPRTCGFHAVSDTRFGKLVHARLDPGAENSGRLVTLLKKQARELAKRDGLELILCDGSPGIACPVISALSGASLAVLVTEPTPSGIHDLKRVAGLCDHFRLPVAVIINKYDLNPKEAAGIGSYCAAGGYVLLGCLPHHPDVTRAMVQKRTLPEYGGPLAGIVAGLWNGIINLAGKTPRPL